MQEYKEKSEQREPLKTMKDWTLKRGTILIGVIFIVFVFIWFIHPMLFSGMDDIFGGVSMNKKRQIRGFTNNVVAYEKFRQLCYSNTDPISIEDLYKFVKLLSKHRHILCRHNYELFNTIYDVFLRYATISVSDSFLLKLKKWLQNKHDLIEAAKNQSLIFIVNSYSYESVVFNTVRASRPVASVVEGDTLNYVRNLVVKSAKTCDLCRYANSTAFDSFGRMDSTHAVITASTFKVDTFDSIIILKTHDPIYFTQTQFIDSMNLAMRWFENVHNAAPTHLYRAMFWDILPKAGSDIIHPHIHISLGDYAYNAKWNQMYNSGIKFSMQHDGINYWTSVLQIHTFLGLSFRYGKASLMAYLNPQKDAEILILSEKPCLDFFRLVYFTLRGYIDDMGLYALSMGFVFPKIKADTRYGDELPMMFRVVSRGSADSTRSDIGSFGFFGTVNVNRDPFKLIQQIRRSVLKRQAEKFTYSDWKYG